MAQQSTSMRKRANNRQKEMLVERLHANIELARENTAQREVIDFWLLLSNELNNLGCSRTVQEWQHNYLDLSRCAKIGPGGFHSLSFHGSDDTWSQFEYLQIWTLWVSKVKTKARKIRETNRATGAGVAGSCALSLTDIEEKILDIVGFDSSDGYGDVETAFTASPQAPEESSRMPAPPENELHSMEPEILWNTEAHNSGPIRSRHTRVRGRRSILRRPVIRPVDPNLIASLNENNRLLAEMIGTAGKTVAAALNQNSAAMVRAAEILAAAIQSTRVPIFAHKQEHDY